MNACALLVKLVHSSETRLALARTCITGASCLIVRFFRRREGCRFTHRRRLLLWSPHRENRSKHAHFTIEHSLGHFTDVLQQVKAVGNLLGLWCAARGTIGVRTGSIPTDDFHSRMRFEPGGKTVG